jgi:8-oxo-dGTP diphosphatase
MRTGELPEKAAAREMYEETGLRVSGLRFNGILNFYLGEPKELDQTVFLFSSNKSAGRMLAGKEGELRWFSANAMPYDEMWQDDREWLPLVLDGGSLVGTSTSAKATKPSLATRFTKQLRRAARNRRR